MAVDSNRAEIHEFMLGEEKIEEVDNFVYRDQLLTRPLKAARKYEKACHGYVYCTGYVKHLERQRSIQQAEVTAATCHCLCCSIT